VVLGLLAGAAYGTVPVAARAIESPYFTWFNLAEAGTMALAGLLAFAFQSTAMTRAAVNTSTAPLTVAETVVPAMVGVLLFDDGIRGGWTSAASTPLAALSIRDSRTLAARPSPAIASAKTARWSASSGRPLETTAIAAR